MKVIVRCPKNKVTKSEMEQIIESLFQENKDLRVYVGHLRDELNLSQQQSEARRQVICERDKLIQELNEEVQASNDELENVQCDLVDHVKLQEEMCDTIDDLRIKLAKSESESSQGISAVVKFWEEAVNEKNKAEERAEEYRIALMESDCRVDELEKELDHYKKAASIWQEKAEAIQECREKAEAELRDVSNRFIEMYQEKMDSEKEAREVIADLRDEMNDRNARVDEVQRHNDWLQNEVARLTYERDTAVNGNAELIEENAELRDNLDAVINIKNEYAETIDKMRKKIVAAQSPEFTAHLAKLIIANLPSADK